MRYFRASRPKLDCIHRKLACRGNRGVCASVVEESRLGDPVGAEVLDVLEPEQLGKARPRAVHSALDCADGDAANLGRVFVR